MIVEINDSGKRIDKYLNENTEYTRSKIQKMIENGNILVNDVKVKDSYKVKENEIFKYEVLFSVEKIKKLQKNRAEKANCPKNS